MNLHEIIAAQFDASITSKQATFEQLAPQIATAGEMLRNALRAGNKVLCCGNGGSASDAQHFAAELIGRYVNDRPSLPGISLNTDTSAITAIANDYGYDQVFSRQIEGLGRENDVLVALTTSGNSANILKAIESARERGMKILVLSGKGGGRLKECLKPEDVHLCIPSNTTSRIQEAHIFLIHCFCEIIDN